MTRSLASSGFKLLIAATAAVCLAILCLILDSGRRSHFSKADRVHEFQKTVGGLGMGAAATPAWNLLNYDPRLQSVDDSNLWPIAGSYPYSPSAVSAAVAFRELSREDLKIVRIEQ